MLQIRDTRNKKCLLVAPHIHRWGLCRRQCITGAAMYARCHAVGTVAPLHRRPHHLGALWDYPVSTDSLSMAHTHSLRATSLTLLLPTMLTTPGAFSVSPPGPPPFLPPVPHPPLLVRVYAVLLLLASILTTDACVHSSCIHRPSWRELGLARDITMLIVSVSQLRGTNSRVVHRF